MYKFGNEPSRVTIAKVQTFSISPIAPIEIFTFIIWLILFPFCFYNLYKPLPVGMLHELVCVSALFSGCYIKEKEEVPFETSSCGDFVRWARLELAQAYAHYPLKVACLPFHHHRFFVLGLQRYDNNFNLQIFLQFFLKKSTHTAPSHVEASRLFYTQKIGN